jgi:hypothetical protein
MKPVAALTSIAFLALTTAACSVIDKDPVAERTEIVERVVEKPVKCIETLPPFPDLDPVPRQGIVEQTLARIKREETLRQYAAKLLILVQPCVKPKGDDNVEPNTIQTIRDQRIFAQL